MSRYMMATKAIHTLGDISRDEPDLAIIDSEAGDDYIGEWLTGVGYVGVRFPKATTRELTDDEKAYYRTKVVDAPWGTWPIDPDAPPQAATEDPSGPVEPGEGGGTGAGDREAHRGTQGAMDAAIEAAARALQAVQRERTAVELPAALERAAYRALKHGAATTAVRAAEPLLRQAVAEEVIAIAHRYCPDGGLNGSGSHVHGCVACRIAREVGRGE